MGFFHIQIGDADDVHAFDKPCLSQHHGAEFTGADQADAHRAAGRRAFAQQAVQIHF